MRQTLLVITAISLAISGCGEVQTTNSKPGDSNEVNTSENDALNIVGGSIVTNPQLFFASLRSDNSPGGQSCGGTFISDRVIITAAHCLDGMLMKNLHVAVGETRNLANQTTTRRARIERVIIHPDYNPVALKNDVALLFVDPKERARLGNVTVLPLNANPALPESLRASLKFSGTGLPNLQAFGFGTVTNYGFIPSISLRQATLNVIPLSICKTGKGLGDVDSSQLCAGFFAAGGIDTCQGDSGGPLVVKLANGKASLAGITSFGIGCALANRPGVYTRVSHFKTWIEQNMSLRETVDIQSPRDPNRVWQIRDVVSQRCFSEDNRTTVIGYNSEFSQVFMSIAPKYDKANVLLSNNSPNQQFSTSCNSQFDIPSDLTKSTTKVDLSVGLAEQATDGSYTSRVRLSGQDFKLEKIPADLLLGIACTENQASGRDITFISESGKALLSLGEKYYKGSLAAGAASVAAAGSLISSCSVPASARFGLTSAKVEIRTAQGSLAQYGGESVYASVIIKDSSGRDHRFGLKGQEYNFESDVSGLDSPSAFVQMSPTLRPNRQTYSLKLQNFGTAPVINWELQCNAAFSAKLRAQVGSLSPLRDSALVSDEILQLTGATDRAGWHSLGYLPVATTPTIPGINGRIEAGRTVEMLITVHPSKVSSLACSLNNEEATVLSNPLPVLSRDLIAQRFFSKKAQQFSSGRSKLKAILGLKD